MPDLSQMRTYLTSLEAIVAEVGQQILGIGDEGGEITDTHQYRGHESSTVDVWARDAMRKAIDRHFPGFEGTVRLELQPYSITLLESQEHSPMVLIIDECEGTTNTKRCLAACLPYRPQALVSVALGLTENLSDLIIGAVFTLDRGEVFSSLRVTDLEFMSFFNRRLISPAEILRTRGDSQKRIYVIGYSNSHRREKGEVEQVLYDQKFRVYEGCRSSGMDIIYLLRNGIDAYIDLRHYWSTKDREGREKEAMLEVYDIAGVLPIAMGCGLKVTDAEGEAWTKYQLQDTIPLVIARPGIHAEIIDTIRPLVEQWKKPNLA